MPHLEPHSFNNQIISCKKTGNCNGHGVSGMPITPTATTESNVFVLLSLLVSLFAVTFIVIMQNNSARITVERDKA